MAKTAKASATGRHAGTNGKSGGSHRLVDDVLALAGTLAAGRLDSGADKLMSLAGSMHSFAASLTDLPNLSVQATSAAESLEGLAEYVGHTDIEQMVGDAGTFARRHPFLTLAVTIGAGLAISRYMRPGTAAAAAAKPSRSRKRAAQARARTAANGQDSARA